MVFMFDKRLLVASITNSSSAIESRVLVKLPLIFRRRNVKKECLSTIKIFLWKIFGNYLNITTIYKLHKIQKLLKFLTFLAGWKW
jgi:hypothetical protein